MERRRLLWFGKLLPLKSFQKKPEVSGEELPAPQKYHWCSGAAAQCRTWWARREVLVQLKDKNKSFSWSTWVTGLCSHWARLPKSPCTWNYPSQFVLCLWPGQLAEGQRQEQTLRNQEATQAASDLLTTNECLLQRQSQEFQWAGNLCSLRNSWPG